LQRGDMVIVEEGFF